MLTSLDQGTLQSWDHRCCFFPNFLHVRVHRHHVLLFQAQLEPRRWRLQSAIFAVSSTVLTSLEHGDSTGRNSRRWWILAVLISTYWQLSNNNQSNECRIIRAWNNHIKRQGKKLRFEKNSWKETAKTVGFIFSTSEMLLSTTSFPWHEKTFCNGK